MKNKISDGKTTNIVASAAITAGTYVPVGDHSGGVAINDAAEGETCVLDTKGVFELPLGSTNIGEGALVSMAVGKVVPTDVSSGTGTVENIAKSIGYAMETVDASAATTIKVRLK